MGNRDAVIGSTKLLFTFLFIAILGYTEEVNNPSHTWSTESPRFRRLSSRLFPQFQAHRHRPQCSSLGDGFYPNKADCHTYFLCRRGRAYPFKCPFSAQFQPIKGVCVWTGSMSCPYEGVPFIAPSAIVNFADKDEKTPTATPSYPKKAQIDTYIHTGTSEQGADYTTQSSLLGHLHEVGITDSYKSRTYTNPSIGSAFTSYPGTPEETYLKDPRPSSSHPADPDPVNYTFQVYPTPTEFPDTLTVLKLWMTFAFISSYTTYVAADAPSAEVSLGASVYARLADPSHQPSGTSSILQNLTLPEMQLVIHMWYLQGLITKWEHNTQSDLIRSSTKFFNTIREHVVAKNDGEIIYGITGLLQLSSKKGGGEVRGMMLQTFRRYKLQSPPTFVSYSRQEGECIMWGQFCKTNLLLGGLYMNHREGNALLSFMRAEALNQFSKDQSDIVLEIRREAIKMKGTLPKEVKEAVEMVIGSEGKRLDQVLSVGLLNGDSLGL